MLCGQWTTWVQHGLYLATCYIVYCRSFFLSSRELILVHLKNNRDKFNMLMWVLWTEKEVVQLLLLLLLFWLLSFMSRKLYALAAGQCAAESVDSPSNQEILLGGHLYLMVLKVRVGGREVEVRSCWRGWGSVWRRLGSLTLMVLNWGELKHVVLRLLAVFYSSLQEKLEGYLQFVKVELEKQAKQNPDRFKKDSLRMWYSYKLEAARQSCNCLVRE